MAFSTFFTMFKRSGLLVMGLQLAALSLAAQLQGPGLPGEAWRNKNLPASLSATGNRGPVQGQYKGAGLIPNVPVKGGAANRPASNAFVYSLQDCFTYTDRLKIGGAGSHTFITGSCIAKNGETYTAGYTTDGAGNTVGLIQQFDHTAGIGWTRSVSFANRQVMFNSIRQLPYGDLLAIGSYQAAAPAEKQLLMAIAFYR